MKFTDTLGAISNELTVFQYRCILTLKRFTSHRQCIASFSMLTYYMLKYPVKCASAVDFSTSNHARAMVLLQYTATF